MRLREQRARADGGADQRIGEEQQRRAGRNARRQRRLHAHGEPLRFLREVGLARDVDLRRGPDELQVRTSS